MKMLCVRICKLLHFYYSFLMLPVVSDGPSLAIIHRNSGIFVYPRKTTGFIQKVTVLSLFYTGTAENTLFTKILIPGG